MKIGKYQEEINKKFEEVFQLICCKVLSKSIKNGIKNRKLKIN